MSDADVEVTGEFLPGERCNAHTPRGALASAPAVGRTFYDFGGISGMAPPGYVVHAISCRVPTPGDPSGSSGTRALMILLAVRSGSHVSGGRYTISPNGVSDSVPFTASVSLIHPAYDPGTSGAGTAGAAGGVSLVGESGVLELTRIDPPMVPESGFTEVAHPQILGRFRMRARPKWSMR